MQSVFSTCIRRKSQGLKSFAVLIDPDDIELHTIDAMVSMAVQNSVDYFLVGGSLLINDNFDRCIRILKSQSNIPVFIFPGNNDQISSEADAILLLSLISGRNSELLIGKHVQAAPALKRSGLEIIPTGYMVIDGGNITSVSYMSNTLPIPREKPDIAACTALAGEMLGLRSIYMDAGSGANYPIPGSMIRAVNEQISVPLWVGGGIHTPEQVFQAFSHGADLVVVGNAIENDPVKMHELAAVSRDFSVSEVKN